MKTVIAIIFLCVNTIAFAQNNAVGVIDDLIVKALYNANDTTDINTIKDIIGSKYNQFQKHFKYVPSINPLNPNKLKRFSSHFGKRFHPIDGKYKQHLGLDISAKIGTPIHAPADGIVINVNSSNSGCGNSLKIKHKFGFTTRYCHMSMFIVKRNTKVKKGDVIGFVGNSGKSTGAHLHYEIKKNGKLINPYPFCFISL